MLVNVSRPQHVAVRATARASLLLPFSKKPTKPVSQLFSTFSSLFSRRHIIHEGRRTQQEPEDEKSIPAPSPFYFDTAYSIFAKRPTRPFPPPFASRPSGSFSDPLTTHDRAKYRQARVDGQLLRGITNGDDAILIGHDNFLAVNDGVGAWAQKERGHAALWSRLIAHYWAIECEKAVDQAAANIRLETLAPITWLQTAYEKTKVATSTAGPNEIMGTTTASSALIHHESLDQPVVLATQLGDCAVFIIRPMADTGTSTDTVTDTMTNKDTTSRSGRYHDDDDDQDQDQWHQQLIYKTKEQWHWFDCPRQLGTNSPDTPDSIAVTDTIPVQLDDVVVVVSDGVTDNLWDVEITTKICETFQKWRTGDPTAKDGPVYMARELMEAARIVAMDPYAESPYMERALDEGIAAEGGKLDDISVIVGICSKRKDFVSG